MATVAREVWKGRLGSGPGRAGILDPRNKTMAHLLAHLPEGQGRGLQVLPLDWVAEGRVGSYWTITRSCIPLRPHLRPGVQADVAPGCGGSWSSAFDPNTGNLRPQARSPAPADKAIFGVWGHLTQGGRVRTKEPVPIPGAFSDRWTLYHPPSAFQALERKLGIPPAGRK